MRFFLLLSVLAAAAVGTLWAAEYDYGPLVITQENEFKIIQLFGAPRTPITEPGIAFRAPFVEEVKTFDKRLQLLNVEPVELLIANNERLIVDYYAIWKVVDPLEFLNTYPRGMEQAEARIEKSINSAVQNQVARLSLTQLLARAEILTQLSEQTSEELARTGVEIVDVRINRTELPPKVEPAAYARMREQRNAVSREHRAVGERQAREIRAAAEREAHTQIAKAKSDSEVTMGEGDAEAARIYAEAYGKEPEFYAFVRSLEAYRKTLGSGTVMVVPPEHEFFQFLQPGDRVTAPAQARAPIPARVDVPEEPDEDLVSPTAEVAN